MQSGSSTVSVQCCFVAYRCTINSILLHVLCDFFDGNGNKVKMSKSSVFKQTKGDLLFSN